MGHVLAGFHQGLVEGGWLLVGHAEPSVQLFRSFRAVNAPNGPVFYQKAPPEAVATYLPPVVQDWTAPSIKPAEPPPAPVSARVTAAKRVRQTPVHSPGSSAGRQESRPVDLTAVRALADRGELEQALNGCVALLQGKLDQTDAIIEAGKLGRLAARATVR